MDDFILEIAVVRRRRFFDVLEPVAFAEADIRRFESEQFPSIREAIRVKSPRRRNRSDSRLSAAGGLLRPRDHARLARQYGVTLAALGKRGRLAVR